ncbi:MAG: hypothetical protein Q8O24_11000 [Gallionellaceae bacterium]|nr:hypothetical protein [Gallionellaceae bacterium]
MLNKDAPDKPRRIVHAIAFLPTQNKIASNKFRGYLNAIGPISLGKSNEMMLVAPIASESAETDMHEHIWSGF